METLAIGQLARRAKVNLETIRSALSRLVKKCTGEGPAGRCPILQELESRAKEEK